MIYSGLGILAIAIYAIIFFAFWSAALFITRDSNFLFNSFFLTVFSFAIAGGGVWLIGRWMNNLNPLRLVEFSDGERRVVSKARHTIYTLEMEYWGIIFFLLSVIFFSAKKMGIL